MIPLLSRSFPMAMAAVLFFFSPLALAQNSGTGRDSVAPPAALGRLAEQALTALKSQNGPALAALTEAARGLRFSPYLWDEFDSQVVLRGKDIQDMFRSKRIRRWGSYDGSGDPIRNTPSQYFRRFVWDTDYSRVKDVRWSSLSDFLNGCCASLDETAKEKILAAFPGAQAVIYSFPGVTAPQGGAMDWSWLVLIWIPDGETWRLAGILHNEWTI